jgi:lambda family phage minor tail protein L
MTVAAITTEIQKLEPSAVVELFEMDATDFGGDLLRFHAGTNGLSANVVWQGNTYTAYPIKATGFDFTGNGQLPRPKLTVSNTTGAITLLVLTYDDLLGAKITRKRTMVKYLDQNNFPDLYSYKFDSGTEGWAAGNATLTQSGGVLTWTPTATNATLSKTFITAERYQGNSARWVTARIRRISGTGVWEGNCYYSTPSNTVSSSFRKTINAPTDLAQWNTVTWDMSALTVGGNDYIASEIRSIRLDIVSDATSAWEISDIKITGTNPDADDTAEFPDDVFFIDRKATETRDMVEFELAASFDVAGVLLPHRQIIQNVCVWRYKGTECGYAGTNYFNANDESVGSSGLDVCGKRLTSCKLRFGQNEPLPFGSFPSAGLVR